MLCNFLLADEINRAPAKVQSALLEVMQEDQVTIAGHSYPVPQPFLVLATQNPIESEGTYPLPEAQTDRFLMKLAGGLPDPGRGGGRGRALARAAAGRAPAGPRRPTCSPYREDVASVYVDREVIGYAVSLADATRKPDELGARRAGRLHRVRREPARADRPGAGGTGARAAARADARDALRRARPGARRAAPPARAQLRGAQRRRDRRPGARAGDRGRGARRRRARRRKPTPSRSGPRRDWPRDEPGAARAAGRPQGAGADRRAPRGGARPVVRAPRRRPAARASIALRAWARAPSWRRCAPTSRATTCAGSTPRPPRAPASRTCGSTCPSGW